MSGEAMTRQEQLPKAQPGDVVAKALVRAARQLGLSQGEVAEVVGASAASLSRTFAGERPIAPESAEGRHALLLLRVYRSLDTLVGGDAEKARAWLGARNVHLSGRAPRELLSSTVGLVRIADYLDAMRGHL
jgi:uncharacterized protein (DUF2384 family)